MNLLLILKGFIVGIGKIIPGISGSMLAITLGIYESILEAVTNFFSNPKHHLKLLFNFGLGVLLAITVFSKLILFLLNNYYHETMYLFLGLILGTIIPFTKELKINKKNTFIFIIILIIILLLPSLNSHTEFIFTGSFINYLYTIILGVIDAFTSIVPGISGTAIFMTLGVYEYVLLILSNPFSLVFIIYSIGLIIGIICVCYLMNYLLKKKKEETYSSIFALMIGSIIILLSSIISEFHVFYLLVFIVGIIIGSLFDK